MNHTNYLRVAIGAVAVVAVLGLFGVPVGSYAPFALILLVCPLMMFFMMRGMDHGTSSGHADHRSNPADPGRIDKHADR